MLTRPTNDFFISGLYELVEETEKSNKDYSNDSSEFKIPFLICIKKKASEL